MARSGYSGTHYVPGMTEEQARRAARLELPVLIAVLATFPVLLLTSLELEGTWGIVADVLNWAVWLVLLVEALIMIRLSPDDVAWARSNPLDIAILVLTPPFLPEPLHFLWVLRLLRILDLMPIVGRMFQFNSFRYAAMLAFLAVFGGGIAYAEIEEGRGVDEFDGIWWATTTISTVGYGDQFPTSPGGRVLGMGLMLMGPVLIGLVASGMGRAITQEISRDLQELREEGAAELAEIEEAVEEVEEDVESLTGVDRMIIEKLERISRRLDALERRS